jgi:hypothetical protein
MQLIEDKSKIYILFTNAEEMKERDNWNGWDGLHSTDKFDVELRAWINTCHRGSPLMGIDIGQTYLFSGRDGSVEILVDDVHEVYRMYPHDTTARAYWGEFRRKFSMDKIRCSKMVRNEVSYIIEGTIIYGQKPKSYEFDTFGKHPMRINPHTFQPSYTRNKTWDLSIERSLGPNLKDYSINDCFKYYTLIS